MKRKSRKRKNQKNDQTITDPSATISPIAQSNSISDGSPQTSLGDKTEATFDKASTKLMASPEANSTFNLTKPNSLLSFDIIKQSASSANGTREGTLENAEVISSSKEQGNFAHSSGLMLIVGPEKFTVKLANVFEAPSVQNHIKLETTSKLIPDDAIKWRDDNLCSILYVVDSSDRDSLKEIDETLSILSQRYLMSMDCINFIYAKEIINRNVPCSSIRATDVHEFVQKYQRPLTTVVFEDGWERDQELTNRILGMFLNLNRFFQDASGGSP